jgi:hypothetical protein
VFDEILGETFGPQKWDHDIPGASIFTHHDHMLRVTVRVLQALFGIPDSPDAFDPLDLNVPPREGP